MRAGANIQGYLDRLCQDEPDFDGFFRGSRSLGRQSQSLRTLHTVHGMASQALLRWGEPALVQSWLGRLKDGSALAAVAFSESGAGSDLSQVSTTAAQGEGGDWTLHGSKRWVSFGENASAYLVLARAPEGLSCFWLPSDTAGLSRSPVEGLLGLENGETADLELVDCRVPASHLLGQPGWGLSLLGQEALTLGRLSVAWGCWGGIEACLEESRMHANLDHQLVRRLISRMAVAREATGALCEAAALAYKERSPEAPVKAMMAKLFAAESYAQAAADAVQVQGALGCTDSRGAAQHFRDSKVMEIIEGSQQVLEDQIAGLWAPR